MLNSSPVPVADGRERRDVVRKLPFVPSIFFKTFAVVAVLVVAVWWFVLHFGFYEAMTPADYGGTVISGILFTYLVHLWLLPAEILRGDSHDGDDSAK